MDPCLIWCNEHERTSIAVRFCRKHEQQIEADKHANFLAQKNYNSFWKAVSRSKTPGSVFTS